VQQEIRDTENDLSAFDQLSGEISSMESVLQTAQTRQHELDAEIDRLKQRKIELLFQQATDPRLGFVHRQLQPRHHAPHRDQRLIGPSMTTDCQLDKPREMGLWEATAFPNADKS
jgi:hypothetical protein